MIKNNPFDGDSYFAQFSCIIYHQFKTRKSVTYSSVMAEFMNLSPKEKLPCSVSKCEGYGELKKAFSNIKKMIEEKFGGENFIEKGNNRNREYYYVGKDPDPLVDMINAKTINDLKQYWQFCQDSAGFFPTSWLEHFFRGCRDLISIKSRRRKGELVLSASLDRSLTNIDLLPDLYEAIVSKTVLSIDYKPYEENNRILTFHPHYLKEFNGRWFLFGHADGELPEYGFNVAIDRIMGKPHKVENIPYMSAPSGFYLDFFKNIIGVGSLTL